MEFFFFIFFPQNTSKEVSEGQSVVADLERFTDLSLCLAIDPGGSSRDRIRTCCFHQPLNSKCNQQWRLRLSREHFSLQQRAVVSPG